MKTSARRALVFVAACFVIGVSASGAEATPIPVPVGVFSFNTFVPDGPAVGTNAFFIDNNTGAFATPDFPLIDSLILTGLQVELDGQPASADPLADIGPGSNAAIATAGAPPVPLQFPSTTQFIAAVLTGSVEIKAYRYDDHAGTKGMFTPSGSFIVNLVSLGQPGDFLAPGDFALIDLDGTFEADVPTDTNPVPEPATVFLVGSGLVAAIRARSKRQSRARSLTRSASTGR